MWDFITHFLNNKDEFKMVHDLQGEDFDLCEVNKKHAKLAIIGVIISFIALCLIVTDMVLVPRYSQIGNYFLDIYFVVTVFL